MTIIVYTLLLDFIQLTMFCRPMVTLNNHSSIPFVADPGTPETKNSARAARSVGRSCYSGMQVLENIAVSCHVSG